MGGFSGSKGKGGSSSTTTKTTTYGNTTTSNPYIVSSTNNKGTTTNWQDGTALQSVNNFVDNTIDSLLNQYLNPSVNNPATQAKIDTYNKVLNENTRKNLENNIIAPLAQRNMIRSSQATDLYNNLAKQNNEAVADYTNNLLANSQNDTGNIINNLMNYVLQGWNVINGNQALSLNTSQGNAATTGTGNTTSSSRSSNFGVG